jgi:hypothetical protein
MIVNPPFMSPEPPTPAMARPIISIMELVATPHSSEPSSNIERKIRNVIYDIISSLSFYKGLRKIQLAFKE